MWIDTGRLVESFEHYRAAGEQLGVDALDPELKAALEEPVRAEMKRFARLICHASSLTVVAGLLAPDGGIGEAILTPANFVGKNPDLRPVAYPDSPLADAGFVPSLVFDTDLPGYLDKEEELPLGIANTYPFAALPLTEPHMIEALNLIQDANGNLALN